VRIVKAKPYGVKQVSQRIYKYGGQPFARDYLATYHGEKFDRAFGKGSGKAILHATAGRFVTVILTLPHT